MRREKSRQTQIAAAAIEKAAKELVKAHAALITVPENTADRDLLRTNIDALTELGNRLAAHQMPQPRQGRKPRQRQAELRFQIMFFMIWYIRTGGSPTVSHDPVSGHRGGGFAEFVLPKLKKSGLACSPRHLERIVASVPRPPRRQIYRQ
jgi:hypothetical protein